MKQPFETNGYDGVGVSTSTSTNTGDMDDFSKYVDIETVPVQAEEQGGRARRKRGKVIVGLVGLATIALAAGLFFWVTTGGKKKIDLPVRDRNTQTDQSSRPRRRGRDGAGDRRNPSGRRVSHVREFAGAFR